MGVTQDMASVLEGVSWLRVLGCLWRLMRLFPTFTFPRRQEGLADNSGQGWGQSSDHVKCPDAVNTSGYMVRGNLRCGRS